MDEYLKVRVLDVKIFVEREMLATFLFQRNANITPSIIFKTLLIVKEAYGQVFILYTYSK